MNWLNLLIGGVWLLRNVCGLNLLECMRSHDPRNAPHAPPPATLIPMTDFRFAIGKQRTSFGPLKNGSQLAHLIRKRKKKGGVLADSFADPWVDAFLRVWRFGYPYLCFCSRQPREVMTELKTGTTKQHPLQLVPAIGYPTAASLGETRSRVQLQLQDDQERIEKITTHMLTAPSHLI